MTESLYAADSRSGRLTSHADVFLSSRDRTMSHSRHSLVGRFLATLLITGMALTSSPAADLPDPARVETIKLFEVPNYCEGVVFDHAGKGYISWKETITQFTLDGKHK